MKLCLVLADAELELAPELPKERDEFDTMRSFQNIPVLDAYFHSELVKGLPEGNRRGRPDIVHKCLSLCQNSIPNRKNMLEVFVHTREDRVITVDPQVDIPPNYVEFLNEMGRLLKGESVDGFTIASKDLRQLMVEIGADHVIAMSPSGDERSLKETMEKRSSGKVAAIIGAFPRGDYHSPVYELADAKISLGPELLTAPSVVSEVLSAVPKKR